MSDVNRIENFDLMNNWEMVDFQAAPVEKDSVVSSKISDFLMWY